MKKMLLALGFGLACASTPMFLNAQASDQLEGRVDRLVNRLRSDNAELRKAAEEDLKELGKDAHPILKKARDAANKTGDADLAKRLGALLPKEEAKEPVGPVRKADDLPPPLPKREGAKKNDEAAGSYSQLKFSLWENGKSTKFERDSEGRFKVSTKNRGEEAKTQEFADENEFKAKAPDLHKVFRSTFPAKNDGAKSTPKGEDNNEEGGLPGFGDLDKWLEKIEKALPEGQNDFLKESLKRMRDMQERVRKMREEQGDGFGGDLFKDLFEELGRDMPEGSPLRNFEDLFKQLEGLRGPGDGGQLPRDNKPDDSEEHY
ncbi:MAG: hypothetical protein KDB07_01250 [Planctomycetes bacterium]|nr:hypothetical protein [Planctomycetota bacterium]